MQRLLLILSCVAAVGQLVVGQLAHCTAAETQKRDAWTTSRLVGSPDPPPPYRVELAFPHLKFTLPLDMAVAPGNDRLFVAEQGGKIYSFVNDPTTTKLDLVADLKQSHPELTALYAMTFHPDFERNRYVYVCYIHQNDQPDGTFVSRMTMRPTDPPTLDPDSEQIVIRWWSGGHNGCSLKFGPDGMLYISTGDGGGPDPPDPLQAGQDLTNLLSAILRIDVDRPDGEHSRAYSIPPDNPLINVAGARPEIWSYGFRNPWRMSFDRMTGDLWVGDVGWQLWEMIYRVEKGGNYGWPIMEGPQPVLPETPPGPTPILPPTISHPHSEASSITGGFVYRGRRLSELYGAYIYGDFQTGKVWGLRHDGQKITWHRELAQTPLQLVSFGEDHTGELYLVDYQRSQQIYRLVANETDVRQTEFPRLLSETGLFTSVANQTPAPGVTPYWINAPQWADGTTAQRWMAVPTTEPLQVDANGRWSYPDGSVLVRTVSIELQTDVPQSRRRLETQILQREEGSWRPYTYAWNAEQTDAHLVDAAGLDVPLEIHDSQAPGGLRQLTYRIVGRAECQTCHNPWVETQTTIYGVQSASPLAVNLLQWNRTIETSDAGESGSGSTNQLVSLQQRGWLAGQLPEDVMHAPRFVDPYDASADLNQRARTYLHVNCAHCHQPNAGGTATIDLTHHVKLEDAKLLGVRPAQGAFGITSASLVAPGDPLGSVLYYRMAKTGGGRMPRLGSTEVDTAALAMIHDWVAQLPAAEGSDEQTLSAEIAAAAAQLNSADAAQRAAAIVQLTSSTRGALALMRLLDEGRMSDEARDQILAHAAIHPQTEVRDLFERFVPPSQRVQRLGTVIDPEKLLSLPADAERGRQVFMREGAASCKSCHRIHDAGESLGPDLSQIGKKYSTRDLLTHLLEPSKFMEPKYVPHVVETADGQVVLGLLVEKTDEHIVLRDAQGKEVRIAASDVELMVPQQKSLMPDLLLRDMTPQEAADLLAYLSSLK